MQSRGYGLPRRRSNRRLLRELEDHAELELAGVGADGLLVGVVDCVDLGAVAVEFFGDLVEAVAGFDLVLGLAVDRGGAVAAGLGAVGRAASRAGLAGGGELREVDAGA